MLDAGDRSPDTAFDLLMTVQINGVPVGEDRMSSMAFSFGDMVAYASRGTEVRPGDVLGSGTCGRGCRPSCGVAMAWIPTHLQDPVTS